MPAHHNHRLARPLLMLLAIVAGLPGSGDGAINISQVPLYLGGTTAPLNMLVLGRDHSLYYEAYNDASDLNGDGVLDVGYKPATIDYFGYFDPFKCYRYSTGDARFNPVAAADGKRCDGVSSSWSGDFLNYLTTARIDALRKVLYGGRRVTDSNGLVVVERSYVPQDAHSWGKEYRGIAQDGYDIRQYAPLPLPASGTRHLFANTTLLTSGNKEPLLRVLVHSKYRIWEWVAIERPVAGSRCQHGQTGPVCTYAGTLTGCEIVPGLRLTQTVWRIATTNSSTGGNYPTNAAQFEALVGLNALSQYRCGTRTGLTEVNGTGNPFAGQNGCLSNGNKYLNVFTGEITITEAGTYTFTVDGDDAVELAINGSVVVGWYGGHAKCSDDNCRCNQHMGSVYLTPGVHYVRFRHQEWEGDDSYYLRWRLSTPDSTMTDYVMRTRVCDAAVGLEANCRVYPNGYYKPAGLLQRHGEDDRMYFGLLSGSYTHPYNMRGGVLRKNMGSIRDEVDPETGAFTSVVGIIKTIDRMRIVDFDKTATYSYTGGWLTTKPMAEVAASSTSNLFPDWGNPIGEMLYEAVRYFAGKTGATTEFRPGASGATTETITLKDYAGTASTMTMPLPAWVDPFSGASGTVSTCSAGAMLVISDINPSYDTDTIPGTSFGSYTGDLPGLDATALANAIWTLEHGSVTHQHFIGQVGTSYDGAPSAKSVSGLGNIRGLAPMEPTKQGGYYSASIAKYAFDTDLRSTVSGTQNVNTVVVALASPLPRIEIPVAGTMVTIVPFAKSVDGMSITRTKGVFQPTNTIVDFFVAGFANTDPQGSDADPSVNEGRPQVQFRINFEDVEQGADHDMDAIVLYTVRVNANGTLSVDLSSDYAAGSIVQHIGYVISGTTADGTYLEVRDFDTAAASDKPYFMDTPSGLLPGACDSSSKPAACSNALPLQATRTFTPGSNAATLLNSPLWYAAKYGSRHKTALAEGETPSNYFLVTNAGNLEKQLERAFYEILGLVSSASSAATNSTLLRDDTLVYQARFDSGDWSGEVRAVEVNADGSQGGTRWSTDNDGTFAAHATRRIYTFNGATGLPLTVADMDGLTVEQCASLLDVAPDTLTPELSDCTVGGADTDPTRCLCGDLDGELDLSLAADRLDWLRGDTSKVLDRNFRVRRRLLGDVVNSDPFLVDIKDYAYQPLAATGPETNYDDFLAGLRTATRPPVLYVGANDGMLHALHGNTGVELFAYMPRSTFNGVAELTKPSYSHRYFVDGSPRAVDAYIEYQPEHFGWRTVLVGSTGAGGRAVFALDVTDPNGFDGDDVLWEVTDAELGVALPRPTIARVRSGWVAIIGNGYNSQSARAQLLVLDLASGRVLRRIDTGVGDGTTPNGLSSPNPVDVDGDRIADYVYAGDLRGNLWRFDLTATNKDLWAVSFSGTPLFTATDAALTPQPITARPAVARHPYGGQMIMFGTGKFFSDEDNLVPMDVQVQSFYGIRDNDVPVGARATSLQQQTIVYQGRSLLRAVRDDVRLVSDTTVDYATKSGWYLDLIYAGTRSGERAVDSPVMRTDRVVFTTLIPSTNQCSAGGSSWLMELDFLQGARLPYSVFDLYDDEAFNSTDLISVRLPDPDVPGATKIYALPASALYIPAIAKIPAFVSAVGKDVKYSSLSSGSLLDVDNAPGPGSGRQSWRQLQ